MGFQDAESWPNTAEEMYMHMHWVELHVCVRLFYMSAAKQIACNDLCVNKRVGAQPWKDVAVRDMIVGLELNSCVMSSQNQED